MMKAVTATGCVLAVLMMLVGESRGQSPDDACSYAILDARAVLAVAQDTVQFGGLMCTKWAGAPDCWAAIGTSTSMVQNTVQGVQKMGTECAHENSLLTFLTRGVPGYVNATQQYLKEAWTSCNAPGQQQQCMSSAVMAAHSIASANYQVKTAIDTYMLH